MTPPSRAALWAIRLGFALVVAFTWRQGLGAPALDVASSRPDLSLRLRQVAQEVGIDFRHRATSIDALVANVEPHVTAVGAGVSVTDVDGDGWPDLYATTSAGGESNALYRNLGDGHFEEIAGQAGLAELNVAGECASMGSVWGDYDNDGREDVLVYAWGRCRLFHNESAAGEVRFREVRSALLDERIYCNAATWFDFDADGVLDLYLAGYFSAANDLWQLDTTRIYHESFEFANNGGANRLLKGRGDGSFEDVTQATGMINTRWTYAALAADFDRDGRVDLYLANDYGPEELYLNRGAAGFELASGIGLEGESKSGMCATLGDIFNDGRLAVYVTNISQYGYIFQGNNLRVSYLDRGGDMLQFAEGAVAECGWAWGAQFGDLDRDGLQDLVVVNGFISASRERDYWYQMSKISLGTGSVIADAAQWPAFEDRSLSGYERTRVLLNAGTKNARFDEVGAAAGIDDTYDGRAVVRADLFGSGRLDLVVANQNGPLLVYANESTDEHGWIAFDLVGTRSNVSAFGAEVELSFGGGRQLQTVTAASGFASQNPRQLFFGVGDDPGPVSALVRWPAGGEQRLEGLELGRVHRLEEPRR